MLKRALAIAIVLCFTSFAKASLLLYEPFDYPAGSVLVGQTDTYVTPNQTWAPTGTVSRRVVIAAMPEAKSSVSSPCSRAATACSACHKVGLPLRI